MKRRQFFQNSALVTSGALVGCATPGIAANSPKTPFSVPATYIPIVNSDEMFPVRRVYCIGRNYAAHAREMGSDPTREPPFFFQKPTDAIQHVAAGTVKGVLGPLAAMPGVAHPTKAPEVTRAEF